MVLRVFGDRLKKLRKTKKMTQAQLGQVFGVDHTTISKWEKGVYETDFETIQKIADYFGVSADYLLGKTDDPQKKDITETEIIDYYKIIQASRKKIKLGNPDVYRGREITQSTLDLLESVLIQSQKIIDEQKNNNKHEQN